MAARKVTTLSMKAFRSALTNGSSLFADSTLDERSAWARRFRDLLALLTSDLGGTDALSEAEKALVRRAAMLILQAELLENKFAANDGEATPHQLKLYQTTTNTLRRLLQTTGLKRRARDVTSLGALLQADQLQPEPD